MTARSPGQLEGAAAGDQRAGGHGLAVYLPVRAVGHPVIQPVEQPATAAA